MYSYINLLRLISALDCGQTYGLCASRQKEIDDAIKIKIRNVSHLSRDTSHLPSITITIMLLTCCLGWLTSSVVANLPSHQPPVHLDTSVLYEAIFNFL